MSRKNLILAAAAAGSALGTVLGLLFAPAPGRDTRRQLTRSIRDRKDALIRRGHRSYDGVADYLRAS